MRTLKRTLCLVLAMTMVFGFFGIASAKNASEYPDYDDVQYKEALGVMTGIEVIDGMGGEINPTGKVTRAQAAKMVTYAILGADVAKDLPVTASSFDDVNSYYDWAIPSIEYLADRGIVYGRSGVGGHYDPEGEVTAYEIAKMMLCAAGYGENDEYKGDSWALNVAIDARRNGVFTGTKAGNLNEPATREECALYCFNGLTKVDMVNWSKDEDTYKSTKGDNMGKDVYGLAKSKEAKKQIDAFMRPASTWEIDETKAPNLTNPIAAIADTPVATFNDTSYAKAFADYEFAADADLKIYSNGQEWIGNPVADDPAGTINDLKAAELNGTGIELYNTDKEKDIDVIVLTQAFLAKVTDYTETKGTALGNFKVKVYNPWDKDASTVKTVDDTKKTDDLFDDMVAAELAKDDYILVYAKGGAEGEIMKFAATETVTGALSTYNIEGIDGGFNGKLTVDDTEYTLASACVENEAEGFVAANIENYLTKDVTLYFDEYGMVIGIIPEEVEETINLAYVVDAFKETVTGNYGKETDLVKVQCVDMAGDEAIYLVGMYTEEDSDKVDEGKTYSPLDEKYHAGQLCTVTTEYNDTLKADKATLKPVANDDDGKVNAQSNTTSDKDIPATSPTIVPNNYYSADTTFLFVTGTGSELKVTTATGAQEIPAGKVYSYYSTVATDPNFNVKYVVVAGTPESVQSESLIFTGVLNTNNAVTYTKADGTTDIAYKNYVFIDGQPTQILTTGVNDSTNAPVANGFYTFTKDATTGIYTLTRTSENVNFASVSNVYGNLLSADILSLTTDPKNPFAPTEDKITDANASDSFIVDTVYYKDLLKNGSTELTNTNSLSGLLGTADNAVIAYSYETVGNNTTITGIYVVSQAVDTAE